MGKWQRQAVSFLVVSSRFSVSGGAGVAGKAPGARAFSLPHLHLSLLLLPKQMFCSLDAGSRF